MDRYIQQLAEDFREATKNVPTSDEVRKRLTMGKNRPPFKPDTVFHVYNHSNADDNIFREEENELTGFFQEKYPARDP